jgi:putative ABC transport system permease protein
MSLSPLDLLNLTWRSLIGSPLRSGLTTLGMFVGVAAVNATFQVATISRTVIETQLSEQDAPAIIIGFWPGISISSLDYLRARVQGAQHIAARSWLWGFSTLRHENETVDIDQQNVDILPITSGYLQVLGRQLVAGRDFVDRDHEQFRPVVVLDVALATQLFPNTDALGKTIYMDHVPFTVVGIMSTRASDENSSMLIPFSVGTALMGWPNVNRFAIRPEKPSETLTIAEMEDLAKQVEAILSNKYPTIEHTRSEINVEEILQRRETFGLVSRALLVLGGVSLVVGGIGIANITIAAIMERTREIGLRRAIGATQGEILWQFILEAVVMSVVGGGAAIALIHGVTVVVANQYDLPYEFNRRNALITLGAAIAVGVGSSLLPAIQASRLDPVVALRSD